MQGLVKVKAQQKAGSVKATRMQKERFGADRTYEDDTSRQPLSRTRTASAVL